MANNHNNSNNFSECSEFDGYPYVIVAAVSAGSALVSALCCIFVISLIFLLKKHYFFTQRLILYHSLATLFRSLSTVLRFHRLYDSQTTTSVVCTLSGFTDQLTSWFRTMDYSVITFTLLMTAVFNKNVAHLERFYLVLIFAFPFTFNWIPFINNSFGPAGPWCWIRVLNYEDCSEHKLGIILKNVIYNVPQYTFFVVLSASYLSTIFYLIYQRCCKWGRDVYNQQRERLKKKLHEEVWPLMLYLFGAALLNVVPIVCRVYEFVNDEEPSHILWIFSAILEPLQGGFIALVFTLDRGTLKRLHCSSLAEACKRQENVSEYHCQRSTSILSGEGHETHYKITESDYYVWKV